MRIKEVSIQGFRTYRENTRLDMTQAEGLVLVRGKNEQEERLSSNGAGKTTFFDAISWCLTGETARGAKGPAVESLNGDGKVSVTITFELADAEHVLQRTRKPIALMLDGAPIEQRELDDILGFRAKDFRNAVLIGQFSKLFPDMGPTDRLNYVSQLLDLEMWTDLSQCARDAEKEADSAYREADKSTSLHIGVLQELTADIEALQEEVAEVASDEGGVEYKKQEVREWAVQILSFEEQVDGATKELHKQNSRRSIADKKFTEAYAEATVARQVMDSSEQALTAFEAERKRATDPKVECHTCGSMIDPGDWKARVDRAEQDLKGAWSKFKGAEKAYERLDARCKDLRDTVMEIKDAQRACLKKQSRLKDELRARERYHAEATHELEMLRGQATKLQEKIDAKNKKFRARSKKLVAAQRELDKHSTAVSHNRFWAKSFKDLRLWKLDTAMHMLSVTANSVLQDLGLIGWELRFYSEKENSKVRGFYIDVVAPNTDPRPLEDCSGGELQRLRIACAIGLADLIRSTLPHPPQFEVWDEPTAHLSDAGVWDLVEFFSVRSQERTIFFVDHRVLDSGAFTRILDVVKTLDGSTVSWA